VNVTEPATIPVLEIGDVPAVTTTRHVRLALLALALGGFAIGTTEFVTMGLLPDIARGIRQSIPTTGHVIAAYAAGVVVGAPTIVSIAARLPRKQLAIGLIVSLGIGNALTAVAHGYWPVMAARFVAGLPHGAYFGVATLIAASLVPADRKGHAVSMVMLGLSVATVAGVPASAWLGQHAGWRSAYWAVLAISLVTGLLISAFVPHVDGRTDATIRGELSALGRPAVLLAAATGMVGFGGMFAMYSYIAPLVTDVARRSEAAIPWFLLVFGFGSVVGTALAGRFVDWDVRWAITFGFAATIGTLTANFFTAGSAAVLIAIVFLTSAAASVIAIGLQVRLMHAAGNAQMIGAALNHSSLNVANGLGAYLGAAVIAGGHSYRAPSVVGAGLAVLGLAIFAISLLVDRRVLPVLAGHGAHDAPSC